MQLASGVDPVPVLEWVTLVGVDPDGMAHLMQLLLSVWVDLYLTSQHMFACLVDLPAEGLPSVAETPHKAFAAWRSICAVPSVDHVTQLGGIYPPDWKTNPCERAKKTAGKDYSDLACRGLTFAPPRLRGLGGRAGGGWTSKRLQGIKGFVPPANRSRTYPK